VTMLPQSFSDEDEAPARESTAELPSESRESAEEHPHSLPLWFERGLVVATAGVVSFGGFGLLLAVFGHYRMLTAFALGIAGTVLGTALAWPWRTSGPTSRAVQLPAVGMCLVAAGFGLWNSGHAGHHVAIGRDPGVYTVTAKWIAMHGTLDVYPSSGWSGSDAALRFASPGLYSEGSHLEFQFNHLTPVLMAEADNLGGDALMFRVPILLGALALCAVYAVGVRLVRRPWLVLAAVTALGIALPELNVSRDSYSEPAVQFLLWAGIWLLLVAYERRRLGLSLLAGLTLGGTMLGRIDALVYLIPLPVVAALTWVACSTRHERRSLARAYAAVAAGLLPVAALGTFDVRNRAGHYYADLHGQVHQLQVGLLLSVALAVAVVTIWPLLSGRLSTLRTWVLSRRNAIGLLCGVVAGLGLLAAWALRPAVQHARGTAQPLIGTLQRLAGLPYDPTRAYSEDSVRWISWYLGPITVALAAVGLVVLVARVVQRPQAAPVLVLTIAGLGTATYLWNPSILPDQIWAMRRFVPAALPLFVLLAAVAVDTIATSVAYRQGARWTYPALALGAAGILFFPIAVTAPVRNFEPQAGYLPLINATCKEMGKNAAVVFLPGDGAGLQLMLAVGTWCDVPVARLATPPTPDQLHKLAAGWQSRGRTLWVIGADQAVIKKQAGIATTPVGAAGSRDLEMTIDRPPQFYWDRSLTVYVGRVPA
jgi:hypothetical protein